LLEVPKIGFDFEVLLIFVLSLQRQQTTGRGQFRRKDTFEFHAVFGSPVSISVHPTQKGLQVPDFPSGLFVYYRAHDQFGDR